LIIPGSTVHGQNKKFRPYEAWVTSIGGLTDSYGVLYDVSDSMIVLTNSLKVNEIDSSEPRQVIPYSEIETIKLFRKGKVLRSSLIGLASGAAVGALLGFATHQDSESCVWVCTSAGEDAEIGSVVMALWVPWWGFCGVGTHQSSH
jgi:hypothetical protein